MACALANGEPDGCGRGRLLLVARYENDVVAIRKRRALLERDREMEGVERAQAVVEPVGRLEYDRRPERKQRQWARLAAIGIGPREQPAPAAQPLGVGTGACW